MHPRRTPSRPDRELVTGWRQEVAGRIARRLRASGGTQLAWSAALEVPQPTLSQILNGRIGRLSLELLLRIAARVGLSVSLQPEMPTAATVADRADDADLRVLPRPSRVTARGRAALVALEAHLSPGERAEAFLEHNEWLAALAAAGATRGARR